MKLFFIILLAIGNYITGHNIAYYIGYLIGFTGGPVLIYFTIKYTGIFIGKFCSFIAISIKKESKSNSQKTIIKGDGNTVNNTIEDKEK